MSNRISWDEYAIRLAEVAALRSEDPYQQVGACALDKENRVLGCGYNGLAQGKDVTPVFWHDRDGRRPYMIHAEENLLSLIRRGDAYLLACTLLPCSSCATNIVAHGIKRVVYRHTYLKDTKALDIFDFYNVEVVQIP
jgi:dCMP deaminase